MDREEQQDALGTDAGRFSRCSACEEVNSNYKYIFLFLLPASAGPLNSVCISKLSSGSNACRQWSCVNRVCPNTSRIAPYRPIQRAWAYIKSPVMPWSTREPGGVHGSFASCTFQQRKQVSWPDKNAIDALRLVLLHLAEPRMIPKIPSKLHTIQMRGLDAITAQRFCMRWRHPVV